MGTSAPTEIFFLANGGLSRNVPGMTPAYHARHGQFLGLNVSHEGALPDWWGRWSSLLYENFCHSCSWWCLLYGLPVVRGFRRRTRIA